MKRISVLAALLVAVLAGAASAMEPPGPVGPFGPPAQQQVSDDDTVGRISLIRWRFTGLADPGGDLRGLDARAVGELIRLSLAGDFESVEATKAVFRRYSWNQIEAATKQGGMPSMEHSQGMAEARREMIRQAMADAAQTFDPEGRYEVGMLDSGNKGSGIASDIDQTVFLIDRATGELLGSDDVNRLIAEFDRAFEVRHGMTPERLGIESMNGADFFPDRRLYHNALEFEMEARRVVLEKRRNPEAYRSEGQLKSQAEGRGYQALREHGEAIERLDNEIGRMLAELERLPADSPLRQQMEADLARTRAEVERVEKLSPWTFLSRDAAGNVVIDLGADPRQTKVLAVEPEMAERFAFDGAYDNWFMFEHHPGNRPKYLLRSVAEGVGLLTRLIRGDAGARFDLSRSRRVAAFDYDTEYGRGNVELTRQFVRDIYGHLDARGGFLTTDKITRALDTAARFRLRHKGAPGPGGRPYTEADVYRDYMPVDPRIPQHIAVQAARARWEVDAREIMIENLLITVRAPGEIIDGRFSLAELAEVRQRLRAGGVSAANDPEVLRKAAQLQLYHGIHDLLSLEHARELLEPDPLQRERMRANRTRDLVDRLFDEAQRSGGDEFRATLEMIATEAAAERYATELERSKPTPLLERARALMDARLKSGRAAYEEMRQRYEQGYYTPERVAQRAVNDLVHRVGTLGGDVLDTLGFQGEVRMLMPNEDHRWPALEVEFGEPAFSGRRLIVNMMSQANFDSALQVWDAYLTGGVRNAAYVAARELAMNFPGVAPGAAAYDLLVNGRPEAAVMMGSAILIPGAGQMFVLSSLASTSVRIAGRIALEPLDDDVLNMIYQGYLPPQAGGLVTAGRRELQQGASASLLSPVRLTVIPFTRADDQGREVLAPDGQPRVFYALAPIPDATAVAQGIVASHDELELAHSAGVLGGGPEWEQQLARAADPQLAPERNFEARRASLFYHYEPEVEAWLAANSTDDLEMLVAFEGVAGGAALLTGFFRGKVDDWLYTRNEYAAPDGGMHRVLVDSVVGEDRPEERERFLNRLAFRMATDFLQSYQIVRRHEYSLEAGMRSMVQKVVNDRLRLQGNQLATALREGRDASIEPALATAVHDVLLERRPDGNSRARIHVWPRVVDATEGAASPGAAGDSGAAVLSARGELAGSSSLQVGAQRVNLLVSVVADPRVNPPPYAVAEAEYLFAPDDLGAALSVRVTVRDGAGALVGEPVVKPVGYLAADEEPLVPEPRAVTTCALGDSAAADLADETAVLHCERAFGDVHERDRVAVFFTPARDLRDVTDPRRVFVWQIVDQAGAVRSAGAFVDVDGDRLPDAPLAIEGSPARFADVAGMLPAGAYTVQTADARVADAMLGQGSAVVVREGEWIEEVMFEVAAAPEEAQGDPTGDTEGAGDGSGTGVASDSGGETGGGTVVGGDGGGTTGGQTGEGGEDPVGGGSGESGSGAGVEGAGGQGEEAGGANESSDEGGGEAVDLVVVPDVTGRSIDQAVALIEAAGLIAGLEVAGETADAARAETVAGQLPAAGELAARGATVAVGILVAITGGTVPDVVGLLLPDAIAVLESAGFVPVIELGGETIDAAQVDRVTWQGPAGGYQAEAGSDVTIEIAVAAIEGRVVPDLVGLTAGAANGLAAGADLHLDISVEADAPSAADDGVIMRQYPEPGLEVPVGTTIRAWRYGRYTPPPEPPDPDPLPPDPPVVVVIPPDDPIVVPADPANDGGDQGGFTGGGPPRLTFSLTADLTMPTFGIQGAQCAVGRPDGVVVIGSEMASGQVGEFTGWVESGGARVADFNGSYIYAFDANGDVDLDSIEIWFQGIANGELLLWTGKPTLLSEDFRSITPAFISIEASRPDGGTCSFMIGDLR